MKILMSLAILLICNSCVAEEAEWVNTEAEITEITLHSGKRSRETAIVKFNLENGKEQLANTELFRIPFIGSGKAVGDKIKISYNKDNPVIAETVIGSFFSKYGMYILIILGIIFSIKPILKAKKATQK